MLSFYPKTFYFVVFFILTLATLSCTTPKKVIYFSNLSDSGKAGGLNNAQLNFETAIQKNDLLSITIGGSNPEDLATLNSAAGATTASAATASEGSSGYLVEADGTIKLPFIGKLKAEGLSRLQLEDTLTYLLKDYTKNAVVNVRFQNYKFSVLGEVNNRGRFTMSNERMTILEAISLAGDLTELGRRENVLVVREVNGQRTFQRVNLLSKDLFNSPYFYIKTNDVVYVEPVKSKFISRTGLPQYLGLISLAVTLLLTIITVSK
jgi:polysaccharide export outer membrane protein